MGRASIKTRTCLLLGVLLVACCLQTLSPGTHTPSVDAFVIRHRVGKPKPLQTSRFDELGSRTVPCDLGSLSMVEQGCAPATRGEDPFDIVIHPDGTRAYVVNRSTDNLFVIDLDANQIVEVIDLYPEADHPLGPAPTRLAITPDGSRLLVTNFNEGSLTMIDTATSAIVRTLAVGQTPTDVAISPDSSLAYVPNQLDYSISVIDIAATAVLTTGMRPVVVDR